MTKPWETDPDAWKITDAQPDGWRAAEPWKLEWWELEAEGYGYTEAESPASDP